MPVQSHVVARQSRVGIRDSGLVAVISQVGWKRLHCFLGSLRTWDGLWQSPVLRAVVCGKKVPLAVCFGPKLDSPIHSGELSAILDWSRSTQTQALFGSWKEITFLTIFQGCRGGRISLWGWVAHDHILFYPKRFPTNCPRHSSPCLHRMCGSSLNLLLIETPNLSFSYSHFRRGQAGADQQQFSLCDHIKWLVKNTDCLAIPSKIFDFSDLERFHEFCCSDLRTRLREKTREFDLLFSLSSCGRQQFYSNTQEEMCLPESLPPLSL